MIFLSSYPRKLKAACLSLFCVGAAALSVQAQEPEKVWTLDELTEQGQKLYRSKCAGCHQPDGQGMFPVFPPLKGSRIVNGPAEAHIDIVLHGRPGTPMQSWASLKDIEIAAIITYERNAWGNDSGDIIQPNQVKARR